MGAAPGTAADLLIRLVELGDPGDPDRPDHVCKALAALSFSGRMDEAMELGEAELAAAPDPTALATVRHGVAAALKFAGRTPEVLTLVDLALADEGVPPVNQAQLWSLRAHTLVDGGLAAGEDPAARRPTRPGPKRSGWARPQGAAAVTSGTPPARGPLSWPGGSRRPWSSPSRRPPSPSTAAGRRAGTRPGGGSGRLSPSPSVSPRPRPRSTWASGRPNSSACPGPYPGSVVTDRGCGWRRDGSHRPPPRPRRR
ncbi:hypothetical protein O1L60_03715 [Streptomyces diastatochromogenes]|nr:hypothetical protein [Streptomyces diastatochromogenes]